MQLKSLHQKRALHIVLLVLLLCAVGMMNAFAANHDFTAVAPNGQTLYYKITSSSEYTVMVTHPNSSTSSNNNGSYHYANNPYYQFTRPAGNLIIPYYVEYNGISYSVTAIDSYAFGTTYSNNNACIGLTSVVIPSSVLSIGDKAFARCTGLTTVTIPTSVTSIGSEVFRYCSNLVTVNFNATNCSSVGSNTWNGCTNFTTLNLGNTVTRIPSRGFQGATMLASVTIPKKVQTIGNYAFNGCTNLTNVTIANNSVLTTIAQCAFQSCSYLATINLPNTLASIGNYAFDGCSLLQSTTESQLLPNALETIGDYAFQKASTLAYIHIPSTVTSIGKYAFKSCTTLNTVDFEATNCTYSGTQAEPPFFYCSGLSTVNVSDNVTQIPAYCFKDCTSLTNLTLRNGLSEIGTYAFYCCMNISSLILPTSVTSIGSFAFGNAYDMQIANVESHNPIPPTIGEEVVFPAGQTIYVPYAALNDYESAEYWEDYFFEGMVVKTVSGYGEGEGNYRFIASPLVENTPPTTVENMITETSYDLYRFDQSEDAEWQNYKANSFNLVNGQGYLYANSEDMNLVFKGNFNEDETKEVELAYDTNADFAGWNLVGNPFPVSAYANKSYYVMNAEGTGLEPTALSAGTTIAACTGIMVKADAENETVTFSKPTRLNIVNNGLLHIAVANVDKAIVSFNAGDALEKFVFNSDNARLSIKQDGKDYAIAYAEKQGEMPLNLKTAKNGNYTLTVNTENIEMEYLHLVDNLTGNDIDLLVTPNYNFEAKTTDYASRFKLVFMPKEVGTSTSSATFGYYVDGRLVIPCIEGVQTLQVVDMLGHIVLNENVTGSYDKQLDITPGVYVVRLNERTQKMVVE